tara:strand:- start:1 stop:645 length:645 start_codon:yes stop_codon:yes gene_type:complete
MNYFDLIFVNKSILRIFQLSKFKSKKLNGNCIEFGADYRLDKNFVKPFSKKYTITYSNILPNKKLLRIDLQKKINHKKKYDKVIIFNVLEHLSNYKRGLKNLFFLLKKNGEIIGSTPFLYQIHGAPKDYTRFTKQHLEQILRENNFKNIFIEELGTGPFLACISLLRGYIKYIPFIYQALIMIAVLFDKILSLLMKTNPKVLFPIGYIFFAKKK